MQRVPHFGTEGVTRTETSRLRPGADAVDVKRAYRRLVRDLHPDTNQAASTHERVHLSERFQRVTEAYKTLVA